MNIGDELSLKPKTFLNTDNDSNSGRSPRQALVGKIIYIHPRGRHFTAEFTLPGGTVKESFTFSELEENHANATIASDRKAQRQKLQMLPSC